MPKVSSSPSSTKSSNSPAKMSDVALRKKKNADAQAAFRARRANYIGTLEETVTNLESVVIQLQESCREARHETQELRQENGRLRLQLKEREHFWRSVWSRRNQGDAEEFPAPPTFSPTSFNATITTGSQVHQYPGDGSGYREDTTVYDSSSAQAHSPTMTYSAVETDMSGQRASKYSQKYPSYFPPVTRTSWPPQPITQSSSSGESGTPLGGTHSPSSPNYGVDSPTLAPSEMPLNRFLDEQKVSVTGSLETTPFVFSSSRSLSPSTSTPPSTASASLAPFAFHLPDTVQDRHNAGESALSRAPSDVALGAATVGTDARYGHPDRRTVTQDGSISTVLPPHSSGSDNGSQHGSDGDSGGGQISGTLAVIKAQSFGGLRRSRTRTKRPVETAAKVAMDVLESRGLGTGAQAGVKRRRLDDDEIDVPS
ncbi:hypothetical protein AAF712_000908 [Marasmius tenuissimus]|uniref:BZIP domain-containing protein n=1 Tax=Marasmius tenuissimus TaxID=585030 RepID=A0ABR3ADI6_9AGAR|nr:hypothetical protein PM082_002785 [Marasmius tenuissimus]